MKKSWLYGCSFILLSIFATACGDDEKDIYGIFYADIVTCHTNKGNPYFTYQTTDSAPVDTLYPVSEVNSDDMGEGSARIAAIPPDRNVVGTQKAGRNTSAFGYSFRHASNSTP